MRSFCDPLALDEARSTSPDRESWPGIQAVIVDCLSCSYFVPLLRGGKWEDEDAKDVETANRGALESFHHDAARFFLARNLSRINQHVSSP